MKEEASKINSAITQPIGHNKIVNESDWVIQRKQLLAKEKELLHLKDEVNKLRRALPWVKVEKPYTFDGPDGKVSLADLFDCRSQLIVQHFMFGPGWEEGCVGCSYLADHVDCARRHFEHADVSFVTVSRAPYAEFAPFKKRMGWTFNWVSSNESDFNFDYHVSFTPEEKEKGEVYYNYEMGKYFLEELHGVSVFYKDENGDIFHTYSTYARGGEPLLGTLAFLDLVPKGRNETDENGKPIDWLRHHDKYEDTATNHCCCG
ncbi:thioredoxin family protein [Mucilaginibacter gynuensis]|uniref:Thioredoxin family protein n=1 Tax=Mucilaginibacter gynuensis TaxID=1302236 RepID=A0ABP8G3D1_9SPHI